MFIILFPTSKALTHRLRRSGPRHLQRSVQVGVSGWEVVPKRYPGSGGLVQGHPSEKIKMVYMGVGQNQLLSYFSGMNISKSQLFRGSLAARALT